MQRDANRQALDRHGICRTARNLLVFRSAVQPTAQHKTGVLMTQPAPAAATPPKLKKVYIPMLMEKKKKKEPIVQLAVYDYEKAIVADRIGIDIL
jgi:hypothetical protein